MPVAEFREIAAEILRLSEEVAITFHRRHAIGVLATEPVGQVVETETDVELSWGEATGEWEIRRGCIVTGIDDEPPRRRVDLLAACEAGEPGCAKRLGRLFWKTVFEVLLNIAAAEGWSPDEEEYVG